MVAKAETDIINDALSLIGAKAADEGAAGSDYIIGRRFLNRMVKQWETTGLHLWTRRQATLFYQPGQKRYVIPSSTDHATEEFVETTITADASSGATSVVVADSTGMTVADNFAVAQDNGILNWTTISTITPTTPPAATITFPDALTDDAASGNRVYAYTTGLGKLLRVPDSRRFQSSSGSDGAGQEIPQVQMAHIDYFELPNKDSAGTPVQFYYNPRVDDGEFYIWPVPTSQDDRGPFTYYKPIGEFTTTATTADFPDEWTQALVFNLAKLLAPVFPDLVSDTTLIAISMTADQSYNDVRDWDQGDESIFLEYSPMRW